MAEEIMLKNSIFGGYRKQDVLDYLDSVLVEKDAAIQNRDEKIENLERENFHLRQMVSSATVRKNQTEVQSRETAGNLRAAQRVMQMPEGVYEIRNQKFVRLEDPKEQHASLESFSVLTPDIQKTEKSESVLHHNGIGQTQNTNVPDHDLEEKEMKKLKEQLETVQKEKEKLQAKVEYSQELLIRLMDRHEK